MSEWIKLTQRMPPSGQIVQIKFPNEVIKLVKYDPEGENDFWLIEEPNNSRKHPRNPNDYDDSQMILIEKDDYQKISWKLIGD